MGSPARQASRSPPRGRRAGNPRSTSATPSDRARGRGQAERTGLSAWGWLVLVLSALVALAAASKLVTSDSYTFGYSLAHLTRHLGLRTAGPSKPIVEQRTFTPAEMARYDGTDPALPIYLAVDGKVFDVTTGSRHYGPGGGYHGFAGRDASRAFVTGCFVGRHLTHDVRGLDAKGLEAIRNWAKFYETHGSYFQVGTVLHEPIDPASPVPGPCEG